MVTDSNQLLREERDRLAGNVKDLEAKKQRLESDMIPLRESNKQLIAQKDISYGSCIDRAPIGSYFSMLCGKITILIRVRGKVRGWVQFCTCLMGNTLH